MKKMKVVAALDNSPVARAVLSTAAAIAELLAARVEAVHVREAGPATTAAAVAEAERTALSLSDGPTAGALVAASDGDDVCALVLGMRAAPAGHRPVGPTAGEVITTVGKPVVVVPEHSALPVRVKSVLIPLDGTASTSAAMERTIEWARDAQLDVHLLHVYEAASLPFFDDQSHHEAPAWSREFRQRHSPRTADVHVQVRTGIPGDVVLAVAHELEAGMIALAWLQELLPERARVVQSVLALSSVPVLLVPASSREREPVSAIAAGREAGQ